MENIVWSQYFWSFVKNEKNFLKKKSIRFIWFLSEIERIFLMIIKWIFKWLSSHYLIRFKHILITLFQNLSSTSITFSTIFVQDCIAFFDFEISNTFSQTSSFISIFLSCFEISDVSLTPKWLIMFHKVLISGEKSTLWILWSISSLWVWTISS